MDYFVCCGLVYDTRVSLSIRPASLASHLHSISLHRMALTMPDFLVSLVRYPPPVLVSSKFSRRISCNTIPTNQSQIKLPIEEKRQLRHEAMTQFLLKECCLFSSQVTALISREPSLFRRKSTDRARQVLQLFRDSGFTIQQVRKTIIRNPMILTFSVDKQLKPIMEYFKTLGIPDEDVRYIVSYVPRILGYKLDETLNPKILSLLKFFGSKAKLFKALRKAPGIAFNNFEQANNKLKILESAGLLDHEMKQILERDPRFLCSSVGKIEKNMKFLTYTLGLKPNVLVKYPKFLNFSVERRMRPRYKVFKYLNALRPFDDLTSTLITFLSVTEKDFTERFLSGSPEVKMLYEEYKAKTTDVEVT